MIKKYSEFKSSINKNKPNNHTCETMRQPMIMGYKDTYVHMSSSRALFLNEDITRQVANDLSAMLIYHDHLDSESPIYLHINTNGGDLSAMLQILDTIKLISCPLITIGMGKVFSAGALILAAGTKGERHCLQSTSIMMHGAQFSFPQLNDDIAESTEHLKFIDSNNNVIFQLLSQYTGQSLTKIKQDLVREVWLTSSEACDYGLSDHILC